MFDQFEKTCWLHVSWRKHLIPFYVYWMLPIMKKKVIKNREKTLKIRALQYMINELVYNGEICGFFLELHALSRATLDEQICGERLYKE